MAKYTIKGGDTLSKIAASNNTDVNTLLSLNKGNAAVKSANLIVSGGDITLPEPAAVTSPATTPAGSGTTGSTSVPSNALPDSGIAASFGPALQDINDVEDSLDSMFPAPPSDPNDPSNPGYETYQANKGTIAAQAGQAKDQIQTQKDQGTIQQNKALDLLRLSPAGIKQNIDSFIESSNDFEKGIADDLTTLDAEEQSALANNDDTYLAGIRQAKLDYFNMKSQAATTKFNTLASAYNLMLTGQSTAIQEQSFQQTQASNILNTLLPAYAGQDLSKLPADVQAQFESAAGTLGIPASSLQALVANKSVAFHVSKGNYTYFFDNKGNVVSQVYTPSATTGASASTEMQSFLNGDVTSLKNGDNLSAMNALQADAVGSQIIDQRELIAKSIGTAGSNPKSVQVGTNTYDLTTSDGIENYRKYIADNIVGSLTPAQVGQYLGIQASIGSLTTDQKNQMTALVRQSLEQMMPDSYFYNTIGKGSITSINLSSGADTSAIDDLQSQIDDLSNQDNGNN